MTASVRELGRRLGLSPGTVSKALRGLPGASPSTVAQVRQLAAELGWRPDPLLALQGSARRRGHDLRLIAVVSCRPGRSRRRTETLVAELAEHAAGMGYHLRLCSAGEAASLGALGILIDGHELPFPDSALSLPAVQVGGRSSVPCCRVAVDAYATVTMAIAAARQAGFRRIGCALGRSEPINEDDLLRHAAAAHTGIPAWTGLLQDLDACRAWFDRHRPDAVIAFGSFLRGCFPPGTPCAYLHLHPHDRPTRSGILLPEHLVGRCALDLLDQTIRRRDSGLASQARCLLLRPHWHQGTSLVQPTR
jgi:LacI family transcriptional regulator